MDVEPGRSARAGKRDSADVVPVPAVDGPGRRERMLNAFLAISSDLPLPLVLERIVEAAVDVIGARYGALGVLSEDGHGLSEFVNVGIPADDVVAIGHLPEGHGVLGRLIVQPVPLRTRDLTSHPDSYGFPAHHPAMRSFLGVPIRVRDQVFGNLYLTEKRAATEFSEDDESLAVALAGAAGVAIENARLHARLSDLILTQDRERIAADLHDQVIQRLFATGLSLQATARMIGDGTAADRVETAVTDLDETIRQIRSTIFALQAPRVAGRSVRNEILALVTEAAASLGFEPHLRLDGPIDTAVNSTVAAHLLALLREALSNVVRHARAGRVDVSVAVAAGWLTVEVRDDGVGPGAGARPGGLGLPNLRQRAESLGGSMTLTGGSEGTGAVMRWQAPLPRSAR